MLKRSLIFYLILITNSCGTQQLQPDEYIEIERGEKALLFTKNTEELNPVDIVFGMLFDGFLIDDDKVIIETIDGEKVKMDFIYENQHILIEPGLRIIGLSCTHQYGEETYEYYSGRNDVTVLFEGGKNTVLLSHLTVAPHKLSCRTKGIIS